MSAFSRTHVVPWHDQDFPPTPLRRSSPVFKPALFLALALTLCLSACANKGTSAAAKTAPGPDAVAKTAPGPDAIPPAPVRNATLSAKDRSFVLNRLSGEQRRQDISDARAKADAAKAARAASGAGPAPKAADTSE